MDKPQTTIEETSLKSAIQEEYTQVATNPEGGFHFHTGVKAADTARYDPTLYERLPSKIVESFAGTGNPFLAGPIHAGDVVIDLGSGSGFDSLIAALLTGPDGQVIGIDMTPAMLNKARDGAEQMGLDHVEFREGDVEHTGLADGFADVVISNGVLNLSLDKAKTLEEWIRILKPGGRLHIGDIIVERAVPISALNDISLWTA